MNISNKIIPLIKESFKLSWRGKEEFFVVSCIWGIGAYLIAYFVSKLVKLNHIIVIDWALCIAVITYFIWHIIVIRRCGPKKIALSREEKQQAKKDRLKKIARKLFLREPLTKWNPSIIAIAMDLYIILSFLEYII